MEFYLLLSKNFIWLRFISYNVHFGINIFECHQISEESMGVRLTVNNII